MRKVSFSLKLIGLLGFVVTTEAMAFELKSELFGPMELKGALTGYFLSGDRVSENVKRNRVDLASAVLTLQKEAKPIGFNIAGGVYSLVNIGTDHAKTSEYTDIFGPLPILNMEYSPRKNLIITLGRMGTLIGYEAPFTFQNNHIQRGLLWNMQPLFHHGIRIGYTGNSWAFKLGLNDGYYTLGVDSFDPGGRRIKKFSPALEGSLSIGPMKDLSLGINFFIPEKDAYPSEVASPSNKRQYNAVLNYVKGKLSLGLDGLYVEAPKSYRAQVNKRARAHGLALYGVYEVSPVRISLRLEYTKDKKDEGGIDLVGLGDGNRAYTITLTPGYYKDPLFLRGELSYVKAKEDFTYREKNSQLRFGLEAGFSF